MHSLDSSNTYNESGIVQVLEFVIRHLKSFELLPVSSINKAIRNKYIINQKVSIYSSENTGYFPKYEDLSSHHLYLAPGCYLSTQYYFNNSKTEHILQQILK